MTLDWETRILNLLIDLAESGLGWKILITGTHNLLVESNVVYDVMGGAIFIEDGIETGNIIQYNLVVFVRQSTSLLNDDITPGLYGRCSFIFRW